ncbi:MAG: hypothetical protein FD123_3192 [Bacteroidetes bacterium]|nr:MAG: hypothetical protein FD123_3192 [Bacteroidota bacterium]
MKIRLLLPALLLTAGSLAAQEISANLTLSAFNTPENKPYIETYLSVIGNSIVYTKQPNGKFRGTVNVFISITQNDSLKGVKKYTLNSPEISDTAKPVNFLDLQRFPLPAGNYNIQLTISDPNQEKAKVVTNKHNFSIDFPKDSVHVSHIEFLESFKKAEGENVLAKSGYEMIPYVSNFYPPNMQKLTFYAEVYNAQKMIAAEEKFLILSYIESAETGARMSQFSSYSKQSPQKVNVLLSEYPIATLPNGKYYLVVEVRNAVNRLLASRKEPFERLNPGIHHNLDDISALNVENTFTARYTNADSLAEFIRSLRPISSESEKQYAENRIKSGEVKTMQQYLYNFWLKRNEAHPEASWSLYLVEVKKAQKEFGTQTLKGYQTDRGRVYLQYGAPDQRTVVPSEPSSYPYEIWQYYTLRASGNQPNNTTQTNKKFIFYNPDLVTNKYELIHSDARGEIRDDRWQLKLNSRDNQSRSFDQTKGTDHFGKQSNDLYKDPH